MIGPDDTPREKLGNFAMVTSHPLTPMLRLANGLDRFVAVVARTIVLVSGCVLLVLLFGNVVARYAMGGGFSCGRISRYKYIRFAGMGASNTFVS